MIGILVQLALSWLIIWAIEKRDLSVLGFFPTRTRLKDFLIFFLVTALFCASAFLLKMLIAHQQWRLNPKLSTRLILEGTWWNLASVLFEELIFRGVILFILIRRLGSAKAIIISAIAFGIYHWFSFGVIGNPTGMIITFITTGTMGLLLAYGYAKTFSLYIPIGIHLGWNLTQIFIFSQGPIGDGILVPGDRSPFRSNSYLVFFSVTFLPVIAAMLIDYLLIKKHVQEPMAGRRLRESTRLSSTRK
jgi:uncharacterized protein